MLYHDKWYNHSSTRFLAKVAVSYPLNNLVAPDLGPILCGICLKAILQLQAQQALEVREGCHRHLTRGPPVGPNYV